MRFTTEDIFITLLQNDLIMNAFDVQLTVRRDKFL